MEIRRAGSSNDLPAVPPSKFSLAGPMPVRAPGRFGGFWPESGGKPPGIGFRILQGRWMVFSDLPLFPISFQEVKIWFSGRALRRDQSLIFFPYLSIVPVSGVFLGRLGGMVSAGNPVERELLTFFPFMLSPPGLGGEGETESPSEARPGATLRTGRSATGWQRKRITRKMWTA